jgi:hypothetical protein
MLDLRDTAPDLDPTNARKSGANAVSLAEGNTGGCAIVSVHWTCEVEDPRHAWNLHARELGGPTSARHEVVSGPVREGDEPQA